MTNLHAESCASARGADGAARRPYQEQCVDAPPTAIVNSFGLSLAGKVGRFGVPIIQFKGKTAMESYHRVVPHHTLEIDGKLSLAKKPSLDGNLIIEGDNLIALKSLLPTHAGRIKCIYIDPPYNTGNEGWIYNDNLTQPQFKEWIGSIVGKEGEDACRHDKWCCMMYPRLQLLKELLRDDGAIFVSIDDNEVHHLRMLMDEIFGEENFVATVIWEKVYSPKSSAKYFSENHDFIVIYAKSKVDWDLGLLPRTEEANARYDNPDKDSRGDWKPSDLSARNPYSRGTYAIKCPGGRTIKGPPGGNFWRVSEEKLWALNADNRIWWGGDKNQVPAIKRFLTEVKQGLVPETIWTYKEVGHTQDAKKTVLEVLGNEQVFLTPKPVELLKRIVRLSTEPDDLILDSFAGSGTTAHAVLELNKEDGGNRKFILVQQAFDTKENAAEKFNICEKITRERVWRVAKGYSYKTSSGKTEKVEGLGGEFSYVRVGEQLMGEYRQLGDKLPAYEQIARYVYFTETSQNFDAKQMDKATGKIGEWQGTGYYLLYSPDKKEARALDVEFLEKLKDKNLRKVIYCEKVWVHREDLGRFGDVRPMLVPFNLK
jgi:adenine-specific DNA-methyltransferase